MDGLLCHHLLGRFHSDEKVISLRVMNNTRVFVFWNGTPPGRMIHVHPVNSIETRDTFVELPTIAEIKKRLVIELGIPVREQGLFGEGFIELTDDYRIEHDQMTSQDIILVLERHLIDNRMTVLERVKSFTS